LRQVRDSRRGKHLLNHQRRLVLMMLLTDQCGCRRQWDPRPSHVPDGLLGGLVVKRAARSDVTYAFIVFYTALLVGRSLYFGEPAHNSGASARERRACCCSPSS